MLVGVDTDVEEENRKWEEMAMRALIRTREEITGN